MSFLLAVFSHHYTDWELVDCGKKGKSQNEIHSEETGCPRLVGVYTTPLQAATACYTFVHEFEPDENDIHGGPIEGVSVYAAPINGGPGTGRFLMTFPLTGNRLKFERDLRAAYDQAVSS